MGFVSSLCDSRSHFSIWDAQHRIQLGSFRRSPRQSNTHVRRSARGPSSCPDFSSVVDQSCHPKHSYYKVHKQLYVCAMYVYVMCMVRVRVCLPALPKQVNRYLNTYARIQTHSNMYIRIQIHIHIGEYTRRYVPAYIRTDVYVCTYTYGYKGI